MGFSRALRTAFDFFLKQGDEGPICEICLMALKKPKGVPVAAASACVHLFHPQCLQAWLEIRITEGNIKTIACPSCPTLLTQADVFRLVSPALQAKYLKFKRSAELSANPNVRWCPSPGCETPILGKSHPRLAQTATAALAKTVVVGSAGAVLAGLAGHSSLGVWTATGACAGTWLASATWKHGMYFWKGPSRSRCSKCRAVICFDCSLPYHPDRSCNQTNTALLRRWAEGKDTCHCPSCNSLIERTAGCNYMKCRCGCEFCWLCRERCSHSSGHFRPGGCKQFGGGLAPLQRAPILRNCLIGFVIFVVFLRLVVFSSSSSADSTDPTTDPNLSVPLPASFTVDWTAALMSLAAHIGFELCFALYSWSSLSGRRDLDLPKRPSVFLSIGTSSSPAVNPFRSPASLRYLLWLLIPALAVVRWLLYSLARVGVGAPSAVLVVVVLTSRRRVLRKFLLVSLLLVVNFLFEWPVWFLAWLGELGLSLVFGMALTGGASDLFVRAIGGSDFESRWVFPYHFGRLGIYLAMGSALSLFFCLHFLGLSHWSLRLGLFLPVVCAAALAYDTAQKNCQWRANQLDTRAARMQTVVGVVCFGAVLFLVRDVPTVSPPPLDVFPSKRAVAPVISLFSRAVGIPLVGEWVFLRFLFDVLAIAALPVIVNL